MFLATHLGDPEWAELTVGARLCIPVSFLQHRQDLGVSVLPPRDSKKSPVPSVLLFYCFLLLPFIPSLIAGGRRSVCFVLFFIKSRKWEWAKASADGWKQYKMCLRWSHFIIIQKECTNSGQCSRASQYRGFFLAPNTEILHKMQPQKFYYITEAKIKQRKSPGARNV